MSEHTLLLETLSAAQRIELIGDYIHVHPVEYYRPQGVNVLYVQVSDSTFVAGKYSRVVLSIYAHTGRFESEVKVLNVPGVVCLLQLAQIKLEKKELRTIKRVEILKDVQITINNRPQEVLLKNISLGGCCFQTGRALQNTSGILHLETLKNEVINLGFSVVRERINEEKNTCTYHCKFKPYERKEEKLLEREVVNLQLQQIRRSRSGV